MQPAKYGDRARAKDDYTLMLERNIQQLTQMLEQKNEGTRNGMYGMSPGHETGYHLPSPQIIPSPGPWSVDRNQINSLGISSESSISSKYNLGDFLKGSEACFDIEEGLSRQFLDIFFTTIHTRYPLVDEAEVVSFHNAYFSRAANGYMNDPDQFHFSCARMWLIFAVAAALQKTTSRFSGPPPARYFATALRHAAKFHDSKLSYLQNIELLVLLIFFLSRTDKDSVGLFDIVTDCMSLCVQNNLHRKEAYNDDFRDRKMRCFWSAYLLEKSIACAVSKPYYLQESQMDQYLPLFDYEPSNAVHPNNGVTFINQSIKINRIEARFTEILNIQQGVSSSQLEIVRQFFKELDTWRRDCKGFPRGIENEMLSFLYYRSVRNLLQPFLELLEPEDKLFRECQAAAGQLCQLFKAFHHNTVSGHTTVNIHTCFVAGVTLIYCLWLARNRDDMRRRQLGDGSKHTRPAVSESLFRGLDDLRACSVCLYVMTERSKFAISFRQTFEDLMSATVGNLILRCGPDSSEIVYPEGMPPAIVRRPHHFYSMEEKLTYMKTQEEEIEQAEVRNKIGQLSRSIPKGLSHLLAAPEAASEHPALRRAHPSFHSQEISPFSGRTSTMISNISVWTSQSGQHMPQGKFPLENSELLQNWGTMDDLWTDASLT